MLAKDRTSYTKNEAITRETTIEGKLRVVTVTSAEVETAVKKIKIDKAAGPGNIPAELLKNGPQKLHKMIAQLFTTVMKEHKKHKEWKTGHITPRYPIFKHGNRKNFENYGVISVTSTFKADSHIACRAHAVAMPRPCRSHAAPMPFPCRAHAVPLRV